MTCPRCEARKLVEIDLTVAGRELTLHSCSKCETRWWDDHEGKVVALDELLDLATVRR